MITFDKFALIIETSSTETVSKTETFMWLQLDWNPQPLSS